MNINALWSSGTSGLTGSGTATTSTSTTASQATAATSSASPLLAKAQKRIQTDADATTAQLSKFGLLKSALADAQGSAKALSSLGDAATASDSTVALGTFFKSFNASVAAANTASAGSGSAPANAKRVVQDLKAALRADPSTQAAMKKLGLTVQGDGSLVQDAKQFASALAADPAGVRAALANVGKKVDAVNSRELATNGTVGTALASLNQHSTALTAQQSAMTSLQQAMAAYAATASAS